MAQLLLLHQMHEIKQTTQSRRSNYEKKPILFELAYV